jgi:hypothetical protein
VIDVMKACTVLAMATKTTAVLVIKMMMIMMMLMWGTLRTCPLLLVVATLVTYPAGNSAITTYVHVGDTSAIDVQVTDSNVRAAGIFGYVPVTAAICCHCRNGVWLRGHLFPSTTANCSLETDHP